MDELPLKGDTVIGNDVWIGQNAVILPGVHIGDGAIIGANSVVGRNVEPYTIVAGNPARAIRKRFDDELIGYLLAFKWWDKSIEEINDLIPILTSYDLGSVKKELNSDNRRVTYRQNGAGAEAARKISLSVSVDRPSKDGLDPQRQYRLDADGR